ncbi:hypothetical protein [Agrobacterium salinitolerans]|uniref:hypothetical protein n=1 Tax=Agrobacterium salinitolerans TaxID=1183413 RepID=UPI00174E28D3|nr:hypothetical protein [Agrobacterium salinitolerans]
MAARGRFTALKEVVDFPFRDGCFRLGQAGKSCKKNFKKTAFFPEKKFCGALFVPVRAAADLSEGAKWSAALSRIRAGAVMA